MEWWLTLTVTFVGLMALLVTNMPVALVFFTLNVLGLYFIAGPAGLSLIIPSIFESVGSLTLGAIPLFYLLGEILFQSKAVNIILESVDKLIGKVRARLNVTAICVGTVLGTLSGAAMADAAVLGATLLPEMTRRGYDKTLSLGSILCAGCLGAIIPPSVLAVLIGVLANVSISKLLIAGFLPGLFMASVFILYILVRVRINPGLAPIYIVSKIPNREKMIAVMRTLPFSLIIFLVMGLILLGIATPTEAAGTGVIGALIIVGLFKRLNFQVLKESALATMQLSGMIFFIVAGSKSFSQLLAMSGATKELLETIVNIPIPALGTFAAMQIIPLFLGCFIDPISIIMIAVPIYVPVVEALHFEPVWFWLIFLINMTLGGITPPFGLVLFTLKGASPKEVTIADIYRGAIQFVFLILFCILCITIFPSIAVWLPNYLLP